ncbi:MAG: hypothetical protein UY75_C0020G0008 [Parcubacteria group bacterium GW2011_GWC2_52_8c]|nr:MAG: hypothetical protein UY64_C0021G0011 [Parcubacteria group bacterium GW2011_GWA1_51_12]KKW30951.1 MAG: hypothetical protein UY75_C0020G0008 [Parcubacteria group bacterium GW2011_GWC2_52_8c]
MPLQRFPRDDSRYQWTHHVIDKMRYYGLSEGRVRRVLASPKRREEGIAPGTVAVMQSSGSKAHPYEVWVMYQVIKTKAEGQKLKVSEPFEKRIGPAVRKRIITTWRYPGVSKSRGPLPIPEEILQELDDLV